MTDDRRSRIELWLRDRPAGQQSALAVALASLVEPFAALSDQGQPAGGLPEVARMIRDADGVVEVDRARHLLYATPELAGEDEPGGLAWYAFGATVAWIYAADAMSTAPSDGVGNAFARVYEMLDDVDESLGDGLGDTMLAEHLMDWLDRRMRDARASPDTVALEIGRAVHRLLDAASRAGGQGSSN